MRIIERLISMLSLGYILFFYSETMFRARWRPVYSVLTFFVLLMVNHFRAGDVYSVFLVGAVFCWLVEGVVVQTVYTDFPCGGLEGRTSSPAMGEQKGVGISFPS